MLLMEEVRASLIFLYIVLWSRQLYIVNQSPNFLSWHKHWQQLSLERARRGRHAFPYSAFSSEESLYVFLG